MLASNDQFVSIQSNRDTQVVHDRTIGWAGVHLIVPNIPMQFFLEDDLRTRLFLDNKSSVRIFYNPELVTNIRTVTEILELRTNAGNILSTLKYTVPGFGVNSAEYTNAIFLEDDLKTKNLLDNEISDSIFAIQS